VPREEEGRRRKEVEHEEKRKKIPKRGIEGKRNGRRN
jgi:hypothetical protein